MKSYEVVETQGDGRVYVKVTREDETTFGQMVDVSGVKTSEELDKRILDTITSAEALGELQVAVKEMLDTTNDVIAKAIGQVKVVEAKVAALAAPEELS